MTDKSTLDALGIREDFPEQRTKTHDELLLAELKEQTKLLRSMDGKLTNISTAATISLVIFVISAIAFLVSMLSHLGGK